MKKLLLLSFGSLLLLSCSSIDKDARTKIEQHIKENAHDAKSYEFISMEKPDTTTTADTMMKSILLDSLELEKHLNEVEVYTNLIEKYQGKATDKNEGFMYIESFNRFKSELESAEESSEKLKKEISAKHNKINEVKNSPGANQILLISYGLNFRIKNLMGGYYKTNAKIIYYPQNQTWSGVEIANPLDGLLEE